MLLCHSSPRKLIPVASISSDHFLVQICVMCMKASSFNPASLEVEAIAEALRSRIRNKCLASALGWENQHEISCTSICQKRFSSSFYSRGRVSLSLETKTAFPKCINKNILLNDKPARKTLQHHLQERASINSWPSRGEKTCSFKSNFFLSPGLM